MPPIPPKKKPPAPEPVDWKARIIKWGLIVAVVGGIVWMVVAAPKQKQLVCKSSAGSASLHAFGTCVEE